MKRGAWHQFGDRSQLLALEQLNNGVGVGVVISPRDLSRERAVEMAPQYRAAGADLVVDLQFHLPGSKVGKIATYEDLAPFRQSVAKLQGIPDAQISVLQTAIDSLGKDLKATAILAPAVIYEAGRPDIVALNAKLFKLAKSVGDALGIPTYATLVVGSSASNSNQTTDAILSDALGLAPDGWYFAFESAEERIPASHDYILRLCNAGLALSCSGVPVLHAFSGPTSLLSAAFGATGAGVGHSQNLWQFTRERWESSEGSGGGGDAPPRLFSTSLWGTIVYADEYALLSDDLRKQVLTSSPYSTTISVSPPFLQWSRWEANKHLVHLLSVKATEQLAELDAQKACESATEILQQAVKLHTLVMKEGIELTDDTNKYQNSWRAALVSLKAGSTDRFEYLRMIRGL